jgi:hypothetical protein
MNIDIDSKSGKITFTVGEVTININTESTVKEDYYVPKFPVKIVKKKEELFEDKTEKELQDEYLEQLERLAGTKCNYNNSIFEKNLLESIIDSIIEKNNKLKFSETATDKDIEPLIQEINKFNEDNKEDEYRNTPFISINELAEIFVKLHPEPIKEQLIKEQLITSSNYLTGYCGPSMPGRYGDL